MAESQRDPFFIGWLPVPAAYRAFLVPVVITLLALVVGAAVALPYFQHDTGSARWETDTVRTFDGVVFTRPYAMLRVAGAKDGDPVRALLLVEEGKFGALPRVLEFVQGRPEGVPVRVTGTLLHRDDRWLLELAPGEQGMRRLTSEEAHHVPALPWPEAQVLAERTTLRGEIIDPKCYLGAMKPGGGKTHKCCAMLCLSGGIPPMLVTRDAHGGETFYLLTTAEGEVASEMVLPFVGDPVAVSGRLEQVGDVLVLKVEAEGIRRR
jgi:hypothetical protein